MQVKQNDYLIDKFVEQLLAQFPEFSKQIEEVSKTLVFYNCLFGDFGMFMRNQESEDTYIKVNDLFNSYLQFGIDEITNLVFVGFFEGLTLEPLNRLWEVSTGEVKELLKMYLAESSF